MFVHPKTGQISIMKQTDSELRQSLTMEWFRLESGLG